LVAAKRPRYIIMKRTPYSFDTRKTSLPMNRIWQEIRDQIKERQDRFVYDHLDFSGVFRNLEKDLKEGDHYLRFRLKSLSYLWSIDIGDFEFPHLSQPLGRIIYFLKKGIWLCLRFYTYRLFYQQREFNTQTYNTIVYFKKKYEQEIEELSTRLRKFKSPSSINQAQLSKRTVSFSQELNLAKGTLFKERRPRDFLGLGQKTQVVQILAGASPGDAITNYALTIGKILSRLRIQNQIGAPLTNVSPVLKNKPILSLESLFGNGFDSQHALVLYHYSIHSSASDLFSRCSGQKIICYHNITPAKYFLPFSDGRATLLQEGRDNLKNLIPVVDTAYAVSIYNEEELKDLGFKRVESLPLVYSHELLNVKAEPILLKKYSDGKTNFIFVGRLVPNKRIDQILRVFATYHHTINPNSRLLLVGSYIDLEPYFNYLKSLTYELGLRAKNQVEFLGHVVQKELVAYYQVAHIYLCLSEHEGFCLPLIEAMYYDIPVFALSRCAIPETMGLAGVLFKGENIRLWAELIHTVLRDKALKNRILNKQKERKAQFSEDRLLIRLKEILGLKGEGRGK